MIIRCHRNDVRFFNRVNCTNFYNDVFYRRNVLFRDYGIVSMVHFLIPFINFVCTICFPIEIIIYFSKTFNYSGRWFFTLLLVLASNVFLFNVLPEEWIFFYKPNEYSFIYVYL